MAHSLLLNVLGAQLTETAFGTSADMQLAVKIAPEDWHAATNPYVFSDQIYNFDLDIHFSRLPDGVGGPPQDFFFPAPH